jgi:hypothetical protein
MPEQFINNPGYMSLDFLPPKFFPAGNQDSDNSNIREYAGTDSRELFEENLKKMPADWHYRTKKISYSLNTNGYRAPEWDTVEWENSIVMLGCSYVAGIGLAEDETIPYNLSKILNRPVINLGAGGTSIAFSAYNSLLLHNNFPKPWAVINLWTDINRLTRFERDHIYHDGVWNMTPGSALDVWSSKPLNSKIHSQMMINLIRALWIGKTRYWDHSFFVNTSHYIGKPNLRFTPNARDLKHIGREDSLKVAQTIANELG